MATSLEKKDAAKVFLNYWCLSIIYLFYLKLHAELASP